MPGSQMSVVDDASLLGTWRLVSWVSEDVETNERRTLFGDRPTGYMIFTPARRVVAILTASGREAPKNDADKAACFGSMVAYSGRYRLDGNRLTTKVDIAWDEAQVGTEQIRFCDIAGDVLTIETAPFVSPRFGGRIVRAFLTWHREA